MRFFINKMMRDPAMLDGYQSGNRWHVTVRSE